MLVPVLQSSQGSIGQHSILHIWRGVIWRGDSAEVQTHWDAVKERLRTLTLELPAFQQVPEGLLRSAIPQNQL